MPHPLNWSLSKSLVLSASVLAIAIAAVPRVTLAQTPTLQNPALGTLDTENPPSREYPYTLGAGDRINIEILQVPQYSGEREVLVDGTIELSPIGSLNVDGLTLEEAARAIRDRYDAERILKTPTVTVTSIAPRPLEIGVAGEVKRPGSYTIQRQGTQFPTVTRAIEVAGGITQAADLENARVFRPQRNGQPEAIGINLWELLQTGDLRYDVTLRDGDTIFIPTATEINLSQAPQIAAASFASDDAEPVNIVVVGEVFRPGPYTVTGTARTGQAGVPGGTGNTGKLPTVTRAIQVAGGIKPLANIRQIRIYRPTRTGIRQTIDVNLWELLQTGDSSQDVPLQEGDTIFVPTASEPNPAEATQIAVASFSPDTIRVNVVGEVRRPGVVQISPNAPLNQALLSAGGFNNRARKGSVELIRLNLNGTVSRRIIPVDFARGVSEGNNPPLRNEDIVIVHRSDIARISDTLDTAITPVARFLTILNFPAQLFDLF